MAKQQTKTEDALSAVRTAVAAAKTVTSAEAELRAQHAALRIERKGIIDAAASEAECVANLGRLVDAKAEEWARAHAAACVRALSGETEVRGTAPPYIERRVPPRLPSWGDIQGTLRFEDLCGLAPALVKARLSEVVRDSGARFGLPAEERKARLAALDAEIASLEDQHVQLVEGAASVGITLPLLDSVAKRREAEASEVERAARLVADRERGVFPAGGLSVGARA